MFTAMTHEPSLSPSRVTKSFRIHWEVSGSRLPGAGRAIDHLLVAYRERKLGTWMRHASDPMRFWPRQGRKAMFNTGTQFQRRKLGISFFFFANQSSLLEPVMSPLKFRGLDKRKAIFISGLKHVVSQNEVYLWPLCKGCLFLLLNFSPIGCLTHI